MRRGTAAHDQRDSHAGAQPRRDGSCPSNRRDVGPGDEYDEIAACECCRTGRSAPTWQVDHNRPDAPGNRQQLGNGIGRGVTSAATKATDDQVGRPSVSAAGSSRPPASRKPDHRGPATPSTPSSTSIPPDVGSISTSTARVTESAWVASRASPAANVLAPTPPFPPTTPITGATGSSTAGSQAGPSGSGPATNAPVDSCLACGCPT